MMHKIHISEFRETLCLLADMYHHMYHSVMPKFKKLCLGRCFNRLILLMV